MNKPKNNFQTAAVVKLLAAVLQATGSDGQLIWMLELIGKWEIYGRIYAG